MCANEPEGKFMRACDFLERARRGSLQEKTEARQDVAKDDRDGIKGSATA
jgi:hypothetical protein